MSSRLWLPHTVRNTDYACVAFSEVVMRSQHPPGRLALLSSPRVLYLYDEH